METVKNYFVEMMTEITSVKQCILSVETEITAMQKTLCIEDEVLKSEEVQIQEIRQNITEIDNSFGAFSIEEYTLQHVERNIEALQLRLQKFGSFYKMFKVLSALPVPVQESNIKLNYK